MRVGAFKKPGRALVRWQVRGFRAINIEAYAPEQPLMLAHMFSTHCHERLSAGTLQISPYQRVRIAAHVFVIFIARGDRDHNQSSVGAADDDFSIISNYLTAAG